MKLIEKLAAAWLGIFAFTPIAWAAQADTQTAAPSLVSWCRSGQPVKIDTVVQVDPANLTAYQIDLEQSQKVIIDLVTTDLLALPSGDPKSDIQICLLTDTAKQLVYPLQTSGFFTTTTDSVIIFDGLRAAFQAPKTGRYIIRVSDAFAEGKGLAGLPAELLIRERSFPDAVGTERIDLQSKPDGNGSWSISRSPPSTAMGEIFAFAGRAGDIAEIVMKGQNPDSEFDPIVQVAPPGLKTDDPNAFSQIQVSTFDADAKQAKLSMRLRASGIYELYAATGFSSLQPYTLELSMRKAPDIQAVELVPGKVVEHSLSEQVDEQLISMPLNSGRRYLLTVKEADENMVGFTIKVSLGSKPDFKIIGSETSSDIDQIWSYEEFVELNGSQKEIVIKPERTGKIFVKIEPFGAAGKVKFELKPQ